MPAWLSARAHDAQPTSLVLPSGTHVLESRWDSQGKWAGSTRHSCQAGHPPPWHAASRRCQWCQLCQRRDATWRGCQGPAAATCRLRAGLCHWPCVLPGRWAHLGVAEPGGLRDHSCTKSLAHGPPPSPASTADKAAGHVRVRSVCSVTRIISRLKFNYPSAEGKTGTSTTHLPEDSSGHSHTHFHTQRCF